MKIQPYKIVAEGIVIYLQLTPKAPRDEVVGVETVISETGVEKKRIKARVRALPDKGKANKAVIKLIAGWLGVAKSSIALNSGAKARQKSLLISLDLGAECEKDEKVKRFAQFLERRLAEL